MNILQGAGAAGALLNGATNLVRALKQPKLSDETFAEMLRQASAETDPEILKKRAEATAGQRTSEVMTLRDVNGDGFLSRDESGLKADEFTAADLDGDGMLSTDEVKQAILRGAGMAEAKK